MPNEWGQVHISDSMFAPAEERTLADWWRRLTNDDIAATLPKVAEYTAADLQIMGDTMRQWMPGGDTQPERWGIEMAIAFYLLGKIARAVAAYREGRVPSDDTLKDIRIYAVMMQRVRDTGGWPGQETTEPTTED